jgi:hypothetical protein
MASMSNVVARSTIIAAAGGLVLGALTLSIQGVLPGSWNRLANSGAVWIVGAFVVGAMTRDAGWRTRSPVEGSRMIDSPRLIRSVPGAPWLPLGSTAEVWVGDDIEVPEPTVIVRLLVQRDTSAGRELFCVPTSKGFDIPTQFLGSEGGWRSASDGIADLTSQYLGKDALTRCVGFVRNLVPTPDETYRLPVPLAHVPVFTPRESLVPSSDAGTWIGAADGHSLLAERHWWPIACEMLGWPPESIA